jgi:hypothetical protein
LICFPLICFPQISQIEQITQKNIIYIPGDWGPTICFPLICFPQICFPQISQIEQITQIGQNGASCFPQIEQIEQITQIGVFGIAYFPQKAMKFAERAVVFVNSEF